MKFDMGEAWREAMAMIAANREVLLIVAGIFFFLPSVALTLAMPDMQSTLMSSSDPEQIEAIMYGFYADYGWMVALVVLLQVAGYLALLALLRDSAKPTVGEAIKAGFIGILPAIGVYLIVTFTLGVVLAAVIGVGTAVGGAALGVIATILCLVLLVYAMIKLSLVTPVIAIDKVYNPFKVIAKSWRITKGNSFRIFLFYLLILIVYFVVSMVVGLVAAVLLLLGEQIGLIVNGVVSGLLSAAVSVLFVGVLASIHRQLTGPSDEAMRETFE